MPEDIARVTLGLLLACLLPASLPSRRGSGPRDLLVALLLAGYALAPVFPGPQAWVLLVVTPVAALVVRVLIDRRGDWIVDAPAGDDLGTRHPAPVAALAIAAALGAAAAVALAPAEVLRSVGAALLDDGVAVVVLGGLTAVFVGGLLVSAVVAPFGNRLVRRGDDLSALQGSATYIGWLERALLFAFATSGELEAAAIALAAKAFARFPEYSRHPRGFAEYFLVGSLASFVAALAAAILTRLLLGRTPL